MPEIAEEKSLDGYQLLIYNYVINNGEITTQKAKTLLGVKDRRARQVLADMCAAEILERVGATSNLKYVSKRKHDV